MVNITFIMNSCVFHAAFYCEYTSTYCTCTMYCTTVVCNCKPDYSYSRRCNLVISLFSSNNTTMWIMHKLKKKLNFLKSVEQNWILNFTNALLQTIHRRVINTLVLDCVTTFMPKQYFPKAMNSNNIWYFDLQTIAINCWN